MFLYLQFVSIAKHLANFSKKEDSILKFFCYTLRYPFTDSFEIK